MHYISVKPLLKVRIIWSFLEAWTELRPMLTIVLGSQSSVPWSHSVSTPGETMLIHLSTPEAREGAPPVDPEGWKIAEYVTPKYNCRSLDMILQNMMLQCIDNFELRALIKQQMQGDTFSEFLHLPKDRSPKKNPIVLNPLPGNFINQGRLTIITGKEIISGYHTQTNVVTNYHTSHLFFWGPVLFPIPSPSLLRWHSSLSSKTQELLIFPWVSLMFTWGMCVNTLLFVFHLLICLLLQGSQLKTRRVEGSSRALVSEGPSRDPQG